MFFSTQATTFLHNQESFSERYDLRNHTSEKHTDDETRCIRRNIINGQPKDELRFQNRTLDRQRGSEHEFFTRFDARKSRQAKRRFSDQSREKRNASEE